MVYGTDEIGVRGSTCESVSIVGPGAPGGVRLPWAKADRTVRNRPQTAAAMVMGMFAFIMDSGFNWLTFKTFWSNVTLTPRRIVVQLKNKKSCLPVQLVIQN